MWLDLLNILAGSLDLVKMANHLLRHILEYLTSLTFLEMCIEKAKKPFFSQHNNDVG